MSDPTPTETAPTAKSPEARRVDAYLATAARMEPDIAMVDRDAALASIAISLKRIADALDGTMFADRIQDAIYNAIVNGNRR